MFQMQRRKTSGKIAGTQNSTLFSALRAKNESSSNGKNGHIFTVKN
jgi:hypothetical protein